METDELLLFLWKNRYLISNCKITINIYWIQKISIHYNNKDILFYFPFWKYTGQEDCPFISLVFLHSKWEADFKYFKINFLEIFNDIHSICLLYSIFGRSTLYFFFSLVITRVFIILSFKDIYTAVQKWKYLLNMIAGIVTMRCMPRGFGFYIWN